MKSKSPPPRLLPRLRVQLGDTIALGPGKVQVLEAIAATGSIRESATRMNMSYMRAWTLVKTMNQCFHQPLVSVLRGGASQGGAELTETGQAVLQLYHEMESNFHQANASTWQKLSRLIRP